MTYVNLQNIQLFIVIKMYFTNTLRFYFYILFN